MSSGRRSQEARGHVTQPRQRSKPASPPNRFESAGQKETGEACGPQAHREPPEPDGKQRGPRCGNPHEHADPHEPISEGHTHLPEACFVGARGDNCAQSGCTVRIAVRYTVRFGVPRLPCFAALDPWRISVGHGCSVERSALGPRKNKVAACQKCVKTRRAELRRPGRKRGRLLAVLAPEVTRSLALQRRE